MFLCVFFSFFAPFLDVFDRGSLSTVDIHFILQLALCSSQSTPEIEFHANDLYFNNISFAFSRSFLLQLFKLNCNCFPLNAVVALDVVVRLPRLFNLNSSGMNRKKTWIKKTVRERIRPRIYNFSNIFLLWLPASELLSSEIIQADIFYILIHIH